MRNWRASAAVAAAAGIFTFGLVAARPAFATTGTFTGGAVTLQPSNSNSAGSDTSYSIGFTAGNPLPSGGSITFAAPVGTDFTGCSSSCGALYTVAVGNGHAATVGSAAVSAVNGSATFNQVVLGLSSSTIDGTDTVTVTTHQTTNPQIANSTETISESTSTDTPPVNSADYAIDPCDGGERADSTDQRRLPDNAGAGAGRLRQRRGRRDGHLRGAG
jgi:hypothetical protein